MVEKQLKYLTDKRDIADKYVKKSDVNKKQFKSSKYDDIKSNLDTGKTIKNVSLQSDQLISKKKSELFKRVKGGAIVKLLSDELISESIYNLGNEVNDKNINDVRLILI